MGIDNREGAGAQKLMPQLLLLPHEGAVSCWAQMMRQLLSVQQKLLQKLALQAGSLGRLTSQPDQSLALIGLGLCELSSSTGSCLQGREGMISRLACACTQRHMQAKMSNVICVSSSQE